MPTDWLQWPAMVITVMATWMVGSHVDWRRKAGFWLFLGSNALWVVWGLGAAAYGLILLQLALAFLNVRGARKTADAPPSQSARPS